MSRSLRRLLQLGQEPGEACQDRFDGGRWLLRCGGGVGLPCSSGALYWFGVGTGRIFKARDGWPAGSTTVSSLWVAASSSVLAWLVWRRSPWPLPHHSLEFPPWSARWAGRRLQVTSLEASMLAGLF